MTAGQEGKDITEFLIHTVNLPKFSKSENSGISLPPINFGYDGPIIKPFEYVIDEALRIFLRYDSACFMAR